MKKIRLISALMSLIMIIGVLANLSVLPVFADEDDDKNVIKDESYFKKTYLEASSNDPEDKIETMVPKLENEKFIFYVQEETGEWALENKLTKQYMFSNPYKLGSAAEDKKMELLSQIIIKYNDGTKDYTYLTFKDCVMRQQLKVKQLKNGVRVEYTVGNQETRKLLPMMIEKERLENEILANMDQNDRNARNFQYYYTLLTLDGKTEAQQAALLTQYPFLKDFDIYVYDESASERQRLQGEALIKKYCPAYSFEDLQADHDKVGYVAKDKAPAVFKFGIEYSIDSDGLNVRLGANGIRFDESVYTLDEIIFLPYAGAGSADKEGYLFLPDGSGAIMRFEDLVGQEKTRSGKVYGHDFTFHNIVGKQQEVMRLPVFGLVETSTFTERVTDENGEVQTVSTPVHSGYFAIIEEGDSLASITAKTAGKVSNYNTIYTSFNPRPADSYSVGTAGNEATWTVVADRKYTGSYRIKYFMLEDPVYVEKTLIEQASKAAEGGQVNLDSIKEVVKNYKYYDASYVGMADAYRQYLYATKQLTRLTDKDVEKNIPLYIESFGTIDTTEKFLTFPVTVETPLTTFDNLKTMYNNLHKEGIDNINFKLTGFANGGMTSTVPSKVDIQDKVGGEKGFEDFIAFAEKNGIGVYPDFDFVFVSNTDWFDGYNQDKDAVRTIDDRFTQKKEYDPVYQTLRETGNVVISVDAFENFYKGFKKDFTKLGGKSLSVSTLGSSLNTDFDEETPYNREDAREETVRFLSELKKDFGDIMSEEGNAYVFPYVSHLLEVSLDSSRFFESSQAIPFMGMVLHGSVEFAGTPLNTTGNIPYEILKMIENGSNPYFLASYQNVEELKDNELYAQYFSVSYDSWEKDIIKYYKLVNEALKDVQTEVIIDHEFIQGERVPTAEEAEADRIASEKYEEEKNTNKKHDEEAARRDEILNQKLEALKNQNTTPAPGTPETDVPATDTPATDAPATDVPVTEEPGTEETPVEDAEENEETEEETEEPEQVEEVDEDVLDVKTKYLTQKGTVVKVTYSNGKTFILNYNTFDITVDGVLVKGLGFVVVDADAEGSEETKEPEQSDETTEKSEESTESTENGTPESGENNENNENDENSENSEETTGASDATETPDAPDGNA